MPRWVSTSTGFYVTPLATSLLVGAIPGGIYTMGASIDQNGTARTGLLTAGAIQVASTVPVGATLSTLVIPGTTLSPAFTPNTSSYTSTVPNTTTTLNLTPTSAQSVATIAVNGTPVTSGSGQSVNLSVGSNTVNVVVALSSGTTQTYAITVTRAGGSTPTPTPTPTPDNGGSSATDLAITGANIAPLLWTSSFVIIAGAFLMTASIKRRRK